MTIDASRIVGVCSMPACYPLGIPQSSWRSALQQGRRNAYSHPTANFHSYEETCM